jgi:very-short-patch-repair endonuclease
MRKGSWCSVCSKKKKYTIRDCHNYVKNHFNGECLTTTYNNSQTYMLWKCEKSHVFKSKFNNIKVRNSWCGQCNKCPSCGFYKTGGELCDITCSDIAIKKYKEKAKEWIVVRFLQEKLPNEIFIHNKSVGSHCTKNDRENTNGHLFPDILFNCGFYYLIVEVDENKHRGADYNCDKRRMYDIITKLGLPCIFIRYNPDSKESNKEILLKKIEKYLELDIECKDDVWDDFGFKVEYLFYM